MDSKKLVLVVILVLIGGAAFVYFDPLDLDLLGMNKSAVVGKKVAVPAAAPNQAVVPPKAAVPVAPAQVSAPVVPPKPTPIVAAPVVAPYVEPPTQPKQPPLKLAKSIKIEKPASDKPARPKDLDLRHCLEMDTNQAIAKCAGE